MDPLENEPGGTSFPLQAEPDPGWEVNTDPGPVGLSNRYSRLRLVAVGGQGRVYRAWDAVLEREVALKFSRWETPLRKEQLLCEGRALARVKHPGVCPIFEVGELGGELYLAMPWIEGPGLREALRGCGRAERLDLLIQACDAVGAAHEQGLLHLDLKPGNLLLEHLPDGRLQVRVADFGLAAQAGQDSSGRSGTPPYASPEQWGPTTEALTPAADVYAMGILTHLALAGRLPGEKGEGALKGDALAVYQKATAPDPRQRHANAAMLGADLRALRDLRPPPSQPGRSVHRAALWVSRNRAGAALFAGGLLLLALVGIQALQTSIRARARARAAQTFGQEIQSLEFLLRMQHLAPGVDPRPVLAEARRRMEAMRALLLALDADARPAGEFALGRAHQLLGEDPEALEHLESAWKGGYHSSQCALALGLARCTAYLDGLRGLGVGLTEAVRSPALQALRARHALPAASLLAKAAPPGTETAKVLEALQAELEGNGAEAERLAMAALRAPAVQPWEVYPWRVFASFWEYHAQTSLAWGRLDLANEYLQLAWAAQRRGGDAARGDPSLHLTAGWLAFTEAHIREMEGRLPEAGAGIETAIASFRAARSLQPGHELAEKYILDGLRRRLTVRRLHRLPIGTALDEARVAVTEAEAGFPGHRAIARGVARVRKEELLIAVAAGSPLEGPATEALRAGFEHCHSGADLDWVLLALDLDLARAALARKGDPGPFLRRARTVVEGKLRSDPEEPDSLLLWADVLLLEGQHRQAQGGNPDPVPLRQVLATLDRADSLYLAYEWRRRRPALARLAAAAISATGAGPRP